MGWIGTTHAAPEAEAIVKQIIVAVVLALISASAAIAQKNELHNLVKPLGSSTQILIPVAGNTPGANGTHFRSDIQILNYRAAPQALQLFWIPQNGAPGGRTLTIGARRGIWSSDFVAEIVGQTGLGTLIVTPIIAGSDTIDADAQIYVTSRIWTPQPGTNGTTSQTLNTVPLADLARKRLVMIGLRRDNQYRLNAGVINLDNERAQTFAITVAGNDPVVTDRIVLTLQPLSMQQIPLIGPPLSNLQLLVENITADETASPRWFAYGSSIDNVTGDSWSMVGFEHPD